MYIRWLNTIFRKNHAKKQKSEHAIMVEGQIGTAKVTNFTLWYHTDSTGKNVSDFINVLLQIVNNSYKPLELN